MGTFSVRPWLARQIGCPVEELSALDSIGGGQFEVLFARDGEPYGQVYLLAAPAAGSGQGRAFVAAWLPGHSATVVIPAGDEIAW